MCERVPSGLGRVSAPALSASDDEPGDDTRNVLMPPETRMPFAGPSELARALGDVEFGGKSTEVDTGELDVTQAMDAPELPTRGQEP
jgi:hypothetical protein